MAPLVQLDQLVRVHDGEQHRTEHNRGRIERGNPPRVFRSRFTGFHILFQNVDIRKPGQMVAALSAVSLFSLIATVLCFMLARFEKRAVLLRRNRILAAPMFALRLLFLYALVLLVDVMNIWIIIAVAVGHTLGWLLYFVYIKECFDDNRRTRGGDDGNDSDGGGGKNYRMSERSSSVSSQSSDQQRQFWDLT